MRGLIKNKKLISIIMLLLMLFSMIPTNQTVNAVDTGDVDVTGCTGVCIGFDKNGDLTFVTNDRAAATPVTYKTVGWYIRMDDPNASPSIDGITCDTDPDPETAQCNPTADGKGSRLMMTDFQEIDRSEYYDSAGIKRVKTTFRITAAQVSAKFQLDPILKNVKKNMTLYFNSIFQVYEYGNPVAGEYGSLAGIRGARSWADKSGFRQYFDLDLPFQEGPPTVVPNPVTAKFKVQGTGAVLQPDFKVGDYSTDDTTVKYTFPATITSGGTIYKFSCSYVESKNDNTTMYGCPDESSQITSVEDGKTYTAGEYQYFLRTGGQPLTRNPGVFLGGTDIIGMYKIPNDCNCSQVTTISNKSTLVAKVDGSVIAQSPSIQIAMSESKSSIDDWDTYLSSRNNIKVKVTLWRTDTGANNTGAAAIWTPVGSAPAFSF